MQHCHFCTIELRCIRFEKSGTSKQKEDSFALPSGRSEFVKNFLGKGRIQQGMGKSKREITGRGNAQGLGHE